MTKDYYIQFVRTLFPERLPLKLINKMKLTCLSLCLSIGLTYASSSYAQSASISLNLTNQTVADVLETIEKQSDFNFFYNGKLVDVERKVSVNVQDKDVYALLDQLFEATNVAYKVVDKDVILSVNKINTTNQNKKTITGTVVDIYNEPIIGANIIEKGTTNGVITDIDGKFSLEVSPNIVLQVTYIGYLSQEISIKGYAPLKIQLKEDTQKLDEVVVIGYGVSRKSDLTGSVVRADLSTLQESPNISLASSLQGVVPGLNVGTPTKAGEEPSISIRGRNSLSGGASPLIVLDGIIFRGSMIDINPSDIQSVDVLKDASSTAIYGAQASNGVILITSKMGKGEGKPTIEYSGSFSYQQPTNSKMMPMDSEGFLGRVADRHLSLSRIGDDMLTMNPDWNPESHLMDQNVRNGYADGTDTNWWDLSTNDMPYIQTHNLSVRGKSEFSGYYFSVGYIDQENMIKNDSYERYNVRLNLDTKITEWLKIGVQSFFTSSDYSGISPSLSDIMTMPSLASPYDENGDLVNQPYLTRNNPLQAVLQDDKEKRYNLFANFFADVDIPFIKGLNYRLNFSQNLITGLHHNFNELGANFTGSAYKDNNSQYNWTMDHILSYKKDFGKHAISATFLYGAEERVYESTKAESSNFGNPTLGYNNIQAGQSDLQKASSTAWKEASLYQMFRLGYTFDSKYSLTGTVRRDGFSGFGVDNKFGIFPSGAFAWRISEEDFVKNNANWIDNLKLRLSYGANGNRTVGRYQTMAKLGSGSGYLFGDGGSAEQMQWMKSLANTNLKWETTKSFNVGLDFSVLNGRLYGDFEYYVANTTDLLYNINIPSMNGFGNIPTNIGKLKNTGQELSITGVPIKNKDFSWDITFNFSRNRNKVVSILGIDSDGDGREDDMIADKIFMNKPYGVCYDYNITGMWQIADKLNGTIPEGFDIGVYKIEDINKDEKYTAGEDREIIGYTDPAYRFSIQNSLRYKDWEFKFLINSIQGGDDYYYGQPGSGLPNPDNAYQENSFNFDYWTPENPDARYRQLGVYNGTVGEGFSPYIQRSFVRLQDVTLSYNVPSSFLNKAKIKRLKVYVSGKNLLTLTDWDGWDPETGAGLNFSHPVMKSYSVGLNLEF